MDKGRKVTGGEGEGRGWPFFFRRGWLVGDDSGQRQRAGSGTVRAQQGRERKKRRVVASSLSVPWQPCKKDRRKPKAMSKKRDAAFGWEREERSADKGTRKKMVGTERLHAGEGGQEGRLAGWARFVVWCAWAGRCGLWAQCVQRPERLQVCGRQTSGLFWVGGCAEW